MRSFFCAGGDTLDKFPTLRYYNVFNERDIENIDFVAFRKKLNEKGEATRKIIEKQNSVTNQYQK